MEGVFIILCFSCFLLFVIRIVLILKYRANLLGSNSKDIGLLEVVFKLYDVKNGYDRELKTAALIINISLVCAIAIIIIAGVVFFTGVYTFPK